MHRSVDVFLPLNGSTADLDHAFRESPVRWLPAPAGPLGDGRWLVDVHAGPVHVTVACGVGEARPGPEATWRTVRWLPAMDGDRRSVPRLLPVLDAELGLARDTAGAASLVLSGGYEPPAAWLGEVADSLVLRRVADATLQRFLVDVAARLGALGASDVDGVVADVLRDPM